MSYKVAIRKNETGEVRIEEMNLKENFDPKSEGTEYWWTEGNMACDCNRAMLFQSAGGEGAEGEDESCTEGRFTVLYAENPDGRRYKVDPDGSTADA